MSITTFICIVGGLVATFGGYGVKRAWGKNQTPKSAGQKASEGRRS